MAQSVELLLDADAEASVRAQWERLGRASAAHRAHVTLFAAERLAAAHEPALRELCRGLDLQLVLGALTVFGPRRKTCIVVRQVIATAELLALQAAVAEVCGADQHGQFGRGRWSPHVTLARRVPLDDLGAVVGRLGAHGGTLLPAHVTQVRRWDGDARRDWLL